MTYDPWLLYVKGRHQKDGWQLKVAEVDIVKLKPVSLEKNLVSSRKKETCGILRPGIKLGWLVFGELS